MAEIIQCFDQSKVPAASDNKTIAQANDLHSKEISTIPYWNDHLNVFFFVVCLFYVHQCDKHFVTKNCQRIMISILSKTKL